LSFIDYNGSFPFAEPDWSDRWKGRLIAELNDLAHFVGQSLKIDKKYLELGVLRVVFDWPISDKEPIELAAVYPDTFPYMRPQVTITADPKTFPKRHCAPDGTLCLIGRDTGLWPPKITLAELLNTNLSKALFGATDEDPQGEPNEVYWNNRSNLKNGSYLLIDSEWTVAAHNGGYAEVEYYWNYSDKKPFINATIKKLWSDKPNGNLILQSEIKLPVQPRLGKRTAIVKWKRLDSLTPLTGFGDDANIWDQICFNEQSINEEGGRFNLSLTVQKTEVQHQIFGDAWIFSMVFRPHDGKSYNLKGQTKITSEKILVPTYRAGTTDLGFRVPAVKKLSDAKLALFGLGALGAPLAIELARNGIKHLTLIEHDTVEPGNTVRWPLGASSWGKAKLATLEKHINAEYLATKIDTLNLFIGMPRLSQVDKNEAVIIDNIVANADIIVDAMASTAVTWLLADSCRKHKKAMLSLAATPSLKGGTVSCYHPNSGCPVCREWAYEDGLFQRALGADDETTLEQPVGCAERTFSGASYDLQELSLEAMRMIVDLLPEADAHNQSVVHTLALHDGNKRIPPAWRINTLPYMSKCGCQK
jgi:hypothetical protein